MQKNIYLIGMMGSGKSVVSKLLAARLTYDRVDLDDEIVRTEHMPVRQIFEKVGELRFRELERIHLAAVSKKNKVVVATGGGIVTNDDNLALMKQTGVLIYLQASTDVLHAHIGHDNNRPLLQGGNAKERLESIFAARKQQYEKADYVVSVDGKNPDEVAQAVFKILEEKGKAR